MWVVLVRVLPICAGDQIGYPTMSCTRVPTRVSHTHDLQTLVSLGPETYYQQSTLTLGLALEARSKVNRSYSKQLDTVHQGSTPFVTKLVV